MELECARPATIAPPRGRIPHSQSSSPTMSIEGAGFLVQDCSNGGGQSLEVGAAPASHAIVDDRTIDCRSPARLNPAPSPALSLRLGACMVHPSGILVPGGCLAIPPIP
ncbi:hypothetical protein B0T17DRAFT_232018 [Bombardia bombarda]|uniref:Uncharacterized protein n=1 Tax=Bombardia bombarda TaxID=252184 RepID=A0AA39XBU9_9PEZI|nr:hypothetical protein B0T17DRAFT_232018 [Bombardia bombarda]